jgi:uncharacterized membrane protein
MTLAGLALATIAFVGSHLAMSHPLRLRLVRAMGEGGFLLLYSLVSAVFLAWMILAWRGAASMPLWAAPGWWWRVAAAIMLLVSILLAGARVRNPAFPGPAAEAQAKRPANGVFAITRHPMNWAFILWALVHISLWGSPRNLIVAGGILVLAVAGSIGQDRKKRASLGKAWRDWEARTSFVPFAALLRGRLPWRSAAPGAIALAGGALFWIVIISWHAPSVSPIGYPMRF